MLSAVFCSSTSSFRFRSCSANSSASLTIFSLDSFESFVDAVIVILFCFPVPKSLAVTLSIPLASMSKVTSICGTPIGAGGIPVRLTFPAKCCHRPWLSLLGEHGLLPLSESLRRSRRLDCVLWESSCYVLESLSRLHLWSQLLGIAVSRPVGECL